MFDKMDTKDMQQSFLLLKTICYDHLVVLLIHVLILFSI